MPWVRNPLMRVRMTLMSRVSSDPSSKMPAPRAPSPAIAESWIEMSECSPHTSTPVLRMPRMSMRWRRTSCEPAATPIARSARPPPSIARSETRTPRPRTVISDQPPVAAASTVRDPEPTRRVLPPTSRCGTT